MVLCAICSLINKWNRYIWPCIYIYIYQTYTISKHKTWKNWLFRLRTAHISAHMHSSTVTQDKYQFSDNHSLPNQGFANFRSRRDTVAYTSYVGVVLTTSMWTQLLTWETFSRSQLTHLECTVSLLCFFSKIISTDYNVINL